MRILYLSQLVPYPPDAGPKVRIYHVLQYLLQAGHEVTLAAFRRPQDDDAAIEHLRDMGLDVHTVIMPRSPVRDAWHLGRSLVQGEPLLIARDRVEAMHRLIASLMREHAFDAVHADQLWMAQYALAARERLNGAAPRVKLVLDQHNAVHLIPARLAAHEPHPLKRAVLRREARVMKAYELAACARFDQVVWVTDEDRRALGGEALAPGVTIPICVDPQRVQPVLPAPHARRVTFLGGLHWPPNAAGAVWFAREVWPRVTAQAPDARLTIIGKQPPRELNDTPAPRHTLDITGYVADLTPYLQETAVFIVPLHAGGGMRVKILDAWAWGLPVVSTTIGAEGLRYEPGVNLLLADDPESFARAVLRLLDDIQLSREIGRAGRQTVETYYDWRTTYRAWDTIYPAA
jgi:glycosyltransferase involved in cell wall biosynthesis